MIRIGSYRLEFLLQAQQVILPHESQHALVINRMSSVLEFDCYPSVPIAREFQSDLLNLVFQILVFAILKLSCSWLIPPFEVAASAYFQSMAGLSYRQLKAGR